MAPDEQVLLAVFFLWPCLLGYKTRLEVTKQGGAVRSLTQHINVMSSSLPDTWKSVAGVAVYQQILHCPASRLKFITWLMEQQILDTNAGKQHS